MIQGELKLDKKGLASFSPKSGGKKGVVILKDGVHFEDGVHLEDGACVVI